MGRRKTDIDGGKLNIGRELKNLGRTINKKVINPAERGFQTAGKTLGRITNKELMPAVKTIGIPMASGVAGAVGTMYGGPIGGVMASQLTSGLLNQYVPNQSKNPYVGMAGDALSMGMFGSDPMEQMQLMGKMNKQLTGDIIGQEKPKYNPDNPYEDLIGQLMNNYNVPTPAPAPDVIQPQTEEDLSDDFDALYKESQLGDNADSMVVSIPPYQQREGSVQGLLGAGLKKKRGRKKKDIEGIVKVEVIKSIPHKKFSGAKNSSLDQLLEAKAEKEEKQSKKAMKEMVESQSKMLKALGFGIGRGNIQFRRRRVVPYYPPTRENSHSWTSMDEAILNEFGNRLRQTPTTNIDELERLNREIREDLDNRRRPQGNGLKKGSIEAKERMAKIRAMRGKK